MEAVSQALEGGSVDTYVRPTRLVVRGSTGAYARSGAFSSACVPCVRGDTNAHSTDVCRRSGRSVVVNEARVVRFDDNVRHVAVAEGDKIESECLFGV